MGSQLREKFMTVTTGLSGNEIYCLAQKGFRPGNIVVGNSVHSLGVLRGIGAGLQSLIGGELEQITQLIESGRETAYNRMLEEARAHGATGITGVTSELISHGSNIEFLSLGSVLHNDSSNNNKKFSTSANGQELYAQLDAGYEPICFAFGNVAYALGVGRGILASLKTLQRGEIKEYSDIFNQTRHLALQRIINHAKQNNANAVLGIQTTILPFGNCREMLMIGTASYSEKVASISKDGVVTSDMTNIEMWNMASMGYAPMRLLLGTSVYSLGLVGSITSSLKSFVRGEIDELTRLIYDARENAIDIINREAKDIGADDVVGVKTYVYQLGNGLVEFMAIGTAVKKIADFKPQSEQLPPQAIVVDTDTFYDSVHTDSRNVNLNVGNNNIAPFMMVGWIILLIILALWHVF